MRLVGVGVSPGRCCARPHLYESVRRAPSVAVAAEDPATARALLDEAVRASHEELVAVEADVAMRAGAHHAEIFASHRLVLDDAEWIGPIRTRIDAGEPVGVAVRAVSDELADELRAIPD